MTLEEKAIQKCDKKNTYIMHKIIPRKFIQRKLQILAILITKFYTLENTLP